MVSLRRVGVSMVWPGKVSGCGSGLIVTVTGIESCAIRWHRRLTHYTLVSLRSGHLLVSGGLCSVGVVSV